MKRSRYPRLLILVGFLFSCSFPSSVKSPDPTATLPPSPTSPPAAPSATSTTVPKTTVPDTPTPQVELPPLPDLDQRPLYWFAPLPPMPTGPGRPYTGSDDFMDLFQPGPAWQSAAGRIQVFKLYGEWVAYHASDAQLRQAIESIRSRGLALAVEAGPLNAPQDCGQGVEGFAGTQEGSLIARRIQAAGGSLDLIALDEPYYFGHFYDGPNACHWSAREIAAEVDAYIRHMQSFFPEVRVGDTEPTPQPVQAQDYMDWLTTFREVAGHDLAFLHLDFDWSRTDWPIMANEVEKFGTSISVPVGIIYTGNYGDPDDETWISIAGERVKNYELAHGGMPAHVLFQSWNDKPDHVLPENSPFSFTGFIAAYFRDKSRLGFPADSENLAFGKSVRISNFLPGNEGQYAVDRDPGTIWSSGSGPPQWIEVDLGKPYDIAHIRLIPSQYPDGFTVHRVFGRGPGTDGEMLLLTTFEGATTNSQALEFEPPEPWLLIQFIRIETTSSPSWVAWREIEVYALP